MVQKKQGYPEEGEIVIATVTKIQYHSVFCNLDEYDKSGMIHISEIAPGRIKSVHEYVREGKTLVVKVLRVDKGKGHIDLSIRRVTEAQKRLKASELKQHQVVEKVFEQLSEKVKKPAEKLREELEAALDYENLFDAFQDVVEEDLDLVEAGVDKKTAEALAELVRERITPKRVSIKGEFEITSYAPDGVGLVQKSFAEIPESAHVHYLGGGRYAIMVSGKEYKQAEEDLKTVQDRVRETLGEQAEIAFARTDKR